MSLFLLLKKHMKRQVNLEIDHMGRSIFVRVHACEERRSPIITGQPPATDGQFFPSSF